MDQWRGERFGKGSHGQRRGDIGRSETVPSRSRPPHGSMDDGVCAAPLLPAGKFSHTQPACLLFVLIFGIPTVLCVPNDCDYFNLVHRR